MVELTFHRCRAACPAGQFFTLNECPVDRVMKIISAEVGFSASYNPDANPPQCNSRDCRRSTQVPAMLCDGRRSCSIPQSLLIYPQGSDATLCALGRDGNFIRILLLCIFGTTYQLCFGFHYYITKCILHVLHTR